MVLAIVTLLSHSYHSSFSVVSVSASEQSSIPTSHIQDIIIRVKPVEGWKRGSLATIGNDPSIYNAVDKSKIVFPADWNVTERGGKVILVPLNIGTVRNSFNAMVLSSYPSEYASIDESAKIATEMYNSELDDFKLLSMNHTTISSEPAIALAYTYAESQLGRTDVMEVAAIHDQREYLIQYFSNDNKSSEYAPLFTNIVNSINFKS